MERFTTQSLARNRIYHPNLYFKAGNTDRAIEENARGLK